MATTINQYAVYCIEENADILAWGLTPPTICPNDHADRTIDPVRTRIIDSVSTTVVQADDKAIGFYQASSILIDIYGDTGTTGPYTFIHDVSWPFDMTIWTYDIIAMPNMEDDALDVILHPDWTMGFLLAPVTAGDTGACVSSTIFANLKRGFDIALYDGVHNDSLGIITFMDSVNCIIHFSTPAPHNFALYSLINLNYHIVKDFHITAANQIFEFGKKGLKGKQIPAGTVMRVKYASDDSSPKKLNVKIEYYIDG